MNTDFLDGLRLATAILEQKQIWEGQELEVLLCPPATHLHTLGQMMREVSGIRLGAQNVHPESHGAYTGELSVPMLQSVAVSYVLIGHSERRAYFGESNAFLAQKVAAVQAAGLKAVFCCGEPLEEREAGRAEDFVLTQLKESLFDFEEQQLDGLVLAYEPIWAIGTGKTASSQEAQNMHAFLRSELAKRYSPSFAEQTRILYGGSCKASNAKELFAQTDIDGGLIGGASLKAEEFCQIIQAAKAN